MRFLIFLALLVTCEFVTGQTADIKWYSEIESDGILIQNSFPKGGPYTGPTKKYFNHSNLVFVTRVSNTTEDALALSIHFSADSIAIPSSPDTFLKLFLVPDTMTIEKLPLFNYGFSALASLEEPTEFHKKLEPKEECLFRVVAIFYQTRDDVLYQERGGNRAELVLEGQDLFYRMPPQVDSLFCGKITFDK